MEVCIGNAKQTYFRIENTPVLDYEYGGIWYTKRMDNPTFVIVKDSFVSPPLLSCIEKDRIAVPNSKIRVPILEASVIINHQGVLCSNN